MYTYTCAGVFVCVYTLQRGCKAPGDGSDGRMKIQRIQVNSHLHVRCRLRHITHPAGCGEGSSLPELTVSFLGSSDCHCVPQRTVPVVMAPARCCHRTNRDFLFAHLRQVGGSGLPKAKGCTATQTHSGPSKTTVNVTRRGLGDHHITLLEFLMAGGGKSWHHSPGIYPSSVS